MLFWFLVLEITVLLIFSLNRLIYRIRHSKVAIKAQAIRFVA